MKVEETIMEEGQQESVEKTMEDSDPSTTNSTNLVNGSEAREQGENGFLPLPTTATPSPRPVGASATQLTIFYGGRVCVFDGVPAEKAQEILQMAAAAASAVTPHTIATKVDDGGGVHNGAVASSPVFTRCSSIQSTTASVAAAPPLTTTITSSITTSCGAAVAPSPVFTRCLTMQSTTADVTGALTPSSVFRRCLSLHSTTADAVGAVHLPTTNTMANVDIPSAAVGTSPPEFTRCSSMQSTSSVAPGAASPLPQFQTSSISKLQSELPIARRQSLFRFLEKRRDRMGSKSPYPPPPTSKTTTTTKAADEANDDNKVTNISSGDASSQLGCYSQTTGNKSQDVKPPAPPPTVA